jgi:hypothetical protein
MGANKYSYFSMLWWTKRDKMTLNPQPIRNRIRGTIFTWGGYHKKVPGCVNRHTILGS